ncbi:MAG: histidine phosphatase family protein [Marinobacterium sp.]|nr:histidine phosphatase family protein [Marinobacterium sp.]
MQRVFLMRHGIAEPFGIREDCDRALTERGRLLLQAQFQSRADELSAINRIVHSPYRRASETAKIAAQSLGVEQLIIDERLIPDADPVHLLVLLEQHFDNPTLYITHNPFVGRLISLLCEGSTRHVVPVDTGMLVILECEWPAAGMAELHGCFAVPEQGRYF